MTENFARGMKVLIPKGTKVTTLRPGRTKYRTKRNRWVTVFNVYYWKPTFYHRKVPEISWAGSGGYWCHANIEDIIQANYDAGVLERPDISEIFPELA